MIGVFYRMLPDSNIFRYSDTHITSVYFLQQGSGAFSYVMAD
jgi:hypothetical protein